MSEFEQLVLNAGEALKALGQYSFNKHANPAQAAEDVFGFCCGFSLQTGVTPERLMECSALAVKHVKEIPKNN